jgi:hypothetical protein
MYAMSALIPTPKNPEIAGWADSRRISRHTRISAATPSAAPIAGSNPRVVDIGTNTTTGSEE